MIIIGKRTISVRAKRDGKNVSKTFKFNSNTSYNNALNDAKLYESELVVKSIKSNTGYRYISIMKNTDGLVLAKLAIRIKSKTHRRSVVIHSVDEFSDIMRDLVMYVCELTNVIVPSYLDLTKGYETLNKLGITKPKYLYMVSYGCTRILICDYDDTKLADKSGLVVFDKQLIGKAEESVDIGVLCRKT